MAGAIVLFGATGYTGRLVARSLAAAGARPVLAGRDQGRLAALAAELGGLPTAVADADRPERVRGLLGEGDVLVTTVGPFIRRGGAAVRAAVEAGAAYLDAAGEPPFIRRVFEEHGPAASGRCGLVTAFGYDYVPGNLAGALALRAAGGAAARVDVGYFLTGRGGLSTGTLASGAGLLGEPSFAFRDGRLASERSARRVRSFQVDGARLAGVSVGGSEHFALPRLAPALREVNVYLGWFGPLARAVQAGAAAGGLLARLPGARALVQAAAAPLAGRTGAGPDEASRARTGSYAVALAYDGDGGQLAEVRLRGVNPYTFTGAMLAWGARRAAEAGLAGTGALGPVDAFGLDALEAGAVQAGLARVTPG